MTTPTDTLYGSQWHFSQLSSLSGSRLIERIWNDYTGAGIHVGVYDEGVQYSHPDLAANYDASRQVIVNGSTLDGANVGNFGHGTSVAGLIAASRNGTGAVGVAYGASVTGINIFDPGSQVYVNSGSSTILNNFFSAYHQMTSFDVINNSWGSTPAFDIDQNLNTFNSFDQRLVAEYSYGSANGRNGLGTIIVQSAGNDNLDANGEGLNASRYTITVGALHQDGFASSYSNYGACLLVSTSGGDFNTVRAGLGTVSTDLLGVDGYNNRGASGTASDYTNDFGGTSSAAPILTGVISLMLSANSQLGWRDVQNILALSADHTGSAIGAVTPGSEENNTWFINAARNWNGGGMHFSEDYGYGAVNVYAAVRIAEVWSQFASAQTSANETTVTASGAGGLINDLATNTFTFNVAGNIQAEHIDLTLGLTHTAFSDLRIFLVSPQGTEVQLYDGIGGATANGLLWTFGMENFRGENTAGTWTIKIIDAVWADTGTLNSVLFNGFGSTINTNDVYTYTDEFNAMKSLNAARGTLTDISGTDWINAAAISTDVILDLNPNSVVAGRLLTIAAGTTIENAVTGDGNDSITGNSVANILEGMRGNDTINGMGGADQILGGTGNDTMTGGLGNDAFIFNLSELAVGQGDTVTDYTRDVNGLGDRIALNGITYDHITVAVNTGNAVVSYGNGVITDTITLQNIGTINPIYMKGYSDLAHAQADNIAGGYLYVSDANNQAAHTWRNYTITYAANGINQFGYTNNDDNTRDVSNYDSTGVANYSSYISSYTATNQFYYRNTFFRDGTFYTTHIDLTNQPWTSYDESYDNQSRLDYRYTINDDNSSTTVHLDRLINQPWKQYVETYDSQLRLDYRVTTNDDNSLFVTHLDHNNNLLWTSYIDIYNAIGQHTFESFTFDTGQPVITKDITYDNAGQLWDQDIREYNAAHVQTLHYRVMDDLSIVILP